MIATRFSGRADRYTEQDESRTRAMPNDRVQLRPPRRLLAASAAVCTKTQKLLRVKELDPRVCVIDAFSVPSVLILVFDLLCLSRRSPNFLLLLLPPKHCFANALHRALGHFSRLIRTVVENLQHALRILLPLHPSLADRRNPLDQIRRHRVFAFDAANPRGRASLAHPFQPARLFRREQFMPVIHRTNIRVSRIGTALPCRVRYHHFRFRANVRVAFAQRDRIPITLRHLPPVQPRYPRRLRQHRLRLREYFLEKSPERAVCLLELTKIRELFPIEVRILSKVLKL